jgi:hypothetical protein
MRLGLVPENPIEWVIARLNLAPRPLLETQMAYTLARLIMVATKVGVFEALAAGRATGPEVAERCGTSPVGTEKLLFALAGAGYLRAEDGGYALKPVSRKWLLRGSPHSIADKMLLQFHEWDWLERAEDYVRTGDALDLRSMLDAEQWSLYQRGMRAMANAFAGEAVRRMPVPRGAGEMLAIPAPARAPRAARTRHGADRHHRGCGHALRRRGTRRDAVDRPDPIWQQAAAKLPGRRAARAFSPDTGIAGGCSFCVQ